MSLALCSTANSSDDTDPEQNRVHSQVYPSQSNPKCSFGRTSQTIGFFFFFKEKKWHHLLHGVASREMTPCQSLGAEKYVSVWPFQ